MNLEFRSNLCWWHTFLTDWNGLSLLWWVDSQPLDPDQCFRDLAFWSGQWFQWVWPPESVNLNIMAIELAPIVLSCVVWGRQLSGRWILFECDNSSVVSAVNKHYTKEQNAMHLLRCLWFFVTHFDMDARCRHIVVVNNHTTDHLSCNNLGAFFSLNPQAQHHTTSLPQPLLQLLGARGPDWTLPPIQAAVQHYYQKVLHSEMLLCWTAMSFFFFLHSVEPYTTSHFRVHTVAIFY